MIKQEIQKKPIVPAGIRKLLIRAGLLFLAWSLLYHLWLEPLGVPDRQMTALVAAGMVKLLSWFYTDLNLAGSSILINGIQAVNIAPACNGLELIVLYAGFILVMPTNWKRMTGFILGGFLVIMLLNILRCALLAWMYVHQMDLADFAHHYVFKLAIYAVVFYGWILYAKKLRHEAQA